mgnify:CR=1 FL=1
MKIGLFTEFSLPGKSEHQSYADVLVQIVFADELGYDFFSITESFGQVFFARRFRWDFTPRRPRAR